MTLAPSALARITWLAAGCALSLLSSACLVIGDDDDSGALSVVYTFDGLRCDEAGVRDIVVDLAFPDGATHSFTTRCFDDPRLLTIGGLIPGDYGVWISGYGSDDILLYESVGWRNVFVGRDRVHTVNVAVPATLGDLFLSWTFFGDPDCVDVATVRVTLEDPFGVIYDDSTYSCSRGGVAYNNVITGDWFVWMDAIDPSGVVLYLGEGLVRVLPDAGNAFEVDLD